MKESKKKDRQNQHGFMGFPLKDFLHPDAFDIENILGGSFFLDVIKNHIKRSDPITYSKIYTATSKSTSDCGYHTPNDKPDKNTLNGIPGKNTFGVHPDKDKPPFEESFDDFLDGLYLGHFRSNEVRPVATKPPQLYIYDIGFNTDKLTGFIVKNPFDTLISFAPRDPKYPYGRADELLARVPEMFNLKIKSPTDNPKCDEDKHQGAGAFAIPLNNLQQTLSVSTGNGIVKASIVCDLNFRVTVNNRNQLQSVNMYGDTLKIHLSKGLVQPVEKSASGKWVKTGKRFSFNVGDRIITLKKNRLPSWGGKINLDGRAVLITSSSVIGKLNEVNLGGTTQKPLIIFDKVEIINQT